jgi:hypothetical protein
MAHRLLVPPVRRLNGQIRLPEVQHITRSVARQLSASMMSKDALRRAGTSRTGIATTPLAPVQVFTRIPGQMGPNSPANMAPGLRIANAPRLVNQTTGQSAGM